MNGASLLSPELAGILNREFDRNQQEDLASDWAEILAIGYGDLVFEIRGGRVRFVRVKKSRDLTHSSKTANMRAVKK